MDQNNIRTYAGLMRELGLTGLEVSENGVRLRLEREDAKTEPAPLPAAQELPLPDDGLSSILSPMVGVFYSAPAEDAAPFVKVGDRVHPGDVLGIIEAMKLMNEICAEADGIVTEICAEDKQAVDYGRVLFRIRKEQP